MVQAPDLPLAVPGLQFWVVVWYLILALGVMGLVGALPWGRRRGLGPEEVLRGIGTVAISLGMLFLLHGVSYRTAQVLLVAAVGSFLLALRHRRPQRPVLTFAPLPEPLVRARGTRHQGPLPLTRQGQALSYD